MSNNIIGEEGQESDMGASIGGGKTKGEEGKRGREATGGNEKKKEWEGRRESGGKLVEAVPKERIPGSRY